MTSPLTTLKCLDCYAVWHRIIRQDDVIECTSCGSANVIFPWNPKLRRGI